MGQSGGPFSPFLRLDRHRASGASCSLCSTPCTACEEQSKGRQGWGRAVHLGSAGKCQSSFISFIPIILAVQGCSTQSTLATLKGPVAFPLWISSQDTPALYCPARQRRPRAGPGACQTLAPSHPTPSQNAPVWHL